MGISVIITGATGMVGEGVLLECLANSNAERVLVVGRRTCGIAHPKLTELIHGDLGALFPLADKLAGYDACFFCAGVTSLGKKEDEYSKLTYNLTVNFAEVFKGANVGNSDLTFCYVSGYGTDSTAGGKTMWARVKGRTENKILKMFPNGGYMFRPGIMKPIKGQKRILKFYFGWQITYPILRLLMPKFACTLREVALAMINCAIQKPARHVLEVRDIVQTANDK